MTLFHPSNRDRTEASKALFARYEIYHTVVDFLAAIAFLVGSILFFSDKTQTIATWLFVIGSVFFAAKPTLRLIREIRLYRMGQLDKLAARTGD